MLRLSASLFNQPVVSLRVGGKIATATEPIINPHNLKIIGWWCRVGGEEELQVLLADDVRDLLIDAITVNNEEALSSVEDLVRHREIIDLDFKLMGKLVRTKRTKIGHVEDFSYNEGMFVQKLYVGKSLVKVLTNNATAIIDRTQIIEVTDNYILVQDTDIKAGAEEVSAAAVTA
ncbi:MAG TPA: hypothetical protein VFT49_04200 [Candidatus Saccharimonadales bacterium]|nr:hypothetical protein [Candidatus Saccharimonadales bacterium]